MRRKQEPKDEKLDTTSPSTDSNLKTVKRVQTKASTKRKDRNHYESSHTTGKKQRYNFYICHSKPFCNKTLGGNMPFNGPNSPLKVC